jgi:dipeptidyl aminopeptidase/acylaminoacyl peptidase
MSCFRIGLRFSVAFLVLVPAIGAQSQPRGRALAIEDYYRVKTIASVELSPDAHWVTFAVTTRIEDTNGNQSEVWIVPADASAPARRVSDERVNASAPQWTDDGKLRFLAAGRGLIVDPTNLEKVDTVATQAATAGGGRGGGRGGRGGGATSATSPDGRMTAVVRDVPPSKREQLYASEFEKRHEDRFKGVEFDWLDFHRDGGPFPVPNRLDPQVTPPQEVFATPVDGPADGSSSKQMTHLGLRPAGIQWSPDGKTIVFTADSAYRVERSYGRSEIWTVNVDGEVRRLTPNKDFDYRGARFSPDGRWVLSTRQLTTDAVIAAKLTHGGATDLVLVPSMGGAEKILTGDWDYLPANPQWSPDGKYVYVTGGVGGTTHLFRVSPNGGLVEQVTKGERRIGDLSFDRGFTKVVYTVGLSEAPSEVYVASIDGTGEKQLTHVHDAFTSEVALSKADRLQYKSADGTPIEGWLLFPYGYRPNGGPYPLIVSNHGGPHAAIEYGFNFKNQYFAANGYFVLEVNFRSSTGYGEKFLWATWGAWGTKDGQDVMAGIDYALGRYPIDRTRVATIGHSYGGFMTNWLITQYPDRFAAAIPGAGIVNWTSDYGNADIPRTKETEFLGAPWDPKAREIMLKQSPLIYANRVKAPTLFINGEIDQRVPYSEAQQMYVALKKNGVPAKVIQYAGQPHSIGGSWNQVHRMINERRWLDTYLKREREQRTENRD